MRPNHVPSIMLTAISVWATSSSTAMAQSSPICTIQSDAAVAACTCPGPPYANCSHAYGAALAVGNADGDPEIELVIGDPGNNFNDHNSVDLWQLPTPLVGGTACGATLSFVLCTGTGTTLPTTDNFGKSVALIPSLNGDGIADLLVGDPFIDPTPSAPFGTHEGQIFVVDGASGLQLITPLPGSGLLGTPGNDDELGHVVAALQDLTGDGRVEILASAPKHGYGGDSGYVRVINGVTGATINEIRSIDLRLQIAATLPSFPSVASLAHFGSSIEVCDDLDGDTVVDFVVGAQAAHVGGLADSGLLIVFSGATQSILALIRGREADEGFGHAAASLGDVNGDGFTDIAVSSIHGDHFLVKPIDAQQAFDAGCVRVFSGAAIASWSGVSDILPLWTACGDRESSRLGAAIARVPDANGDGAGDLAVRSFVNLGAQEIARLYSGRTGRHLRTWNLDYLGDEDTKSIVGLPASLGGGSPVLAIGCFGAAPPSTVPRVDFHSATPSAKSFEGYPATMSWFNGGYQHLFLNAGTPLGGKIYVTLGSFGLGSCAGVFPLPIVCSNDEYYDLTFLNLFTPFPAVFIAMLGVLNPEGRATAIVRMPAGLPQIQNKTLYHAYAVLDFDLSVLFVTPAQDVTRLVVQ